MYTVKSISPFGATVEAAKPGLNIADIQPASIEALVNDHKILLFKGFSQMKDDQLVSFSSSLGPVLEWEFGKILNLKQIKNPANHILSNGRVELHWDGAYLPNVSRFNVFQCLHSSTDHSGGQTIFVDSESFINSQPKSYADMLRELTVTYSTDKAAHYGGSVTTKLVDKHPYKNAEVLRFIEPYNEDNMEVNPVYIDVHGMSDDEQEHFLKDLISRLYSSEFMYHHDWTTGDIVIVDNHALLHGRDKLHGNVERHIQRVHVLDPSETNCVATFA